MQGRYAAPPGLCRQRRPGAAPGISASLASSTTRPCKRLSCNARRGYVSPSDAVTQRDVRSRAVSGAAPGGAVAPPNGDPPPPPNNGEAPPSASTDLRVIYKRLTALSLPYWTSPEVGSEARWKLAGVVALTLGTTGVSVLFNFLGRDFFNALSEKNPDQFMVQIFWYLGGFTVGIPVFVFKSYFQSKLGLEWRQWMSESLMKQYFSDRTFYSLQAGGNSAEKGVDNPDQRISSDISAFTDTALGLSLTLLNAAIDLVSFSGILFSIYPPLFFALLAYSIGGTAGSIWLGKNLVTLNFNQEAREADFRYNLVRVRENAESIAFFKGEDDERTLLFRRLQAAVANYQDLLISSRNLDFFTSFYRFLIQLLPAVVVAPLFFQGKIEFGVINQSTSAFNHILSDMSLVVYQFESLAGFTAVIDRLGQFSEVMDKNKGSSAAAKAAAAKLDELYGADEPAEALNRKKDEGNAHARQESNGSGAEKMALIALRYDLGDGSGSLLSVEDLTVCTPDGESILVKNLAMKVMPGDSTLIMGPSGAGKTSIMRVVAGLWRVGRGSVRMHVPEEDIMFVPQRPYMVLGSLREQVLYPRLVRPGATLDDTSDDDEHGASGVPSDAAIVDVLRTVRLGTVLDRLTPPGAGPASALDVVTDWSATLSLGEQQRLAWARLLLSSPRLALLDEATSALDGDTEAALYSVLAKSGITFVSVGHRDSLRTYHRRLLKVTPPNVTTGTPPQWQLQTLEDALAVEK